MLPVHTLALLDSGANSCFMDRNFAQAHQISPKQALNSLKNSSKLFSKRDYFSNNGVNHAKAEPLNNVPTKPTRDASVGYREGCI